MVQSQFSEQSDLNSVHLLGLKHWRKHFSASTKPSKGNHPCFGMNKPMRAKVWTRRASLLTVNFPFSSSNLSSGFAGELRQVLLKRERQILEEPVTSRSFRRKQRLISKQWQFQWVERLMTRTWSYRHEESDILQLSWGKFICASAIMYFAPVFLFLF